MSTYYYQKLAEASSRAVPDMISAICLLGRKGGQPLMTMPAIHATTWLCQGAKFAFVFRLPFFLRSLGSFAARHGLQLGYPTLLPVAKLNQTNSLSSVAAATVRTIGLPVFAEN